MKKRKIYFASFDTKKVNDLVLLDNWVIRNIDEKEYNEGFGIESFMSTIFNLPTQSKVWVDKLNFKGRFITSYLEENSFEYMNNNEMKKKAIKGNLYNCLIDNSGSWYNINIKKQSNTLNIIDSSKKIPLNVEKIAEGYQVERLDDKNKDNVNVWLTAISKHINEGLISKTISSDAMNKYKSIIGEKSFKTNFPKLDKETDRIIRKSYHGAFNYLNKHSSGAGVVIDIKSMYPYIMRNFPLPCGKPRILSGKNIKKLDPEKYAQFFEVEVYGSVKENHIPSIKNPLSFEDEKYIEILVGERLVLTYYDIELMKKQYNIDDMKIINQYVFRASKDLFADYVDFYYQIKEMESDPALKQIAKLMLNSLYGKFGQHIHGVTKIPKEDGYIRARITEESTVYVPIASYITSIGRWLIINAAQLNIENLNYSDTDSLHLSCELDDIVCGDFITIGKKLGNYDIEYKYKKAKYLKTKVYYLQGYDNDAKITVAGLTDNKKRFMEYDSFELGMTIKDGSYRTVPTKNGSEMKHFDFTIGIDI